MNNDRHGDGLASALSSLWAYNLLKGAETVTGNGGNSAAKSAAWTQSFGSVQCLGKPQIKRKPQHGN